MPVTKLTFKNEIATGHVLQFVLMILGAATLYYGLVMQITRVEAKSDANAAAIERNIIAINRNVETISQVETRLGARINDADDRVGKKIEAMNNSLLKQMDKFSDDLSWLVRREADRNNIGK